MKKLIVLAISVILSGCALPQPVPQWAVESCLRAHGKPVFTSDAFGSQRYECIINDGRNSLNARYFNDSSMVEGTPPPPPEDSEE
jgi:hypothetical protein